MSTPLPAQPGILQPIPTQARYLSCQLHVGASIQAIQAVLRELAAFADGEATVVGLGLSLVRALGAKVPGLKSFPHIEGALVKLPATPIDLLIWLRGTDRGELLLRSRHLQTLLAPAFELRAITDAFSHQTNRDLSGYEDGTENPKGDDALAAALVAEGPLAGSSFLAVQRWRHQLSHFAAMPELQRDHTFGRAHHNNEELDDAPASAHVKRTAQEDFEPAAFVLRRAMPWAEGNEGGSMFTAFGRSFEAYEALLRRMSGAEDGVTDALFSFTEPETGAYFWCPPVHQGQIDLRAVEL